MVVTAVMALILPVGAVAATFLNNVGGEYQLVVDNNAIEESDILLFASYAKRENVSETSPVVRVMSTILPTDKNGAFANYIYPDCDYVSAGMPKVLKLSQVNMTDMPYEYVTGALSKDGTVTLQNWQELYLSADKSTAKMSLTKTKPSNNWVLKNGVDTETFSLYNKAASKYLRCENRSGYGDDLGQFRLFGIVDESRGYSAVYTYRKTFTVTIGGVGYSTFYNSNNDVKLPKGIKAYTYTLEGNTLVPSHEFDGDSGDVIPHNTAVMLSAAPGVYALTVKNVQTECEYESILRGTDNKESTATDGDEGQYRYYALGNGSHGLGFYYVNNSGAPFMNNPHKAYLRIATTVATSNIRFVLPNEIPTSVEERRVFETQVDNNAIDEPCYDILGRKTAMSHRGYIIKDGIKVLK